MGLRRDEAERALPDARVGKRPTRLGRPDRDRRTNKPLTVTVESYLGEEGVHTTPQPVNSAKVSPVSTAEHTDFQTVEVASPQTVMTEAAGNAVVEFSTPGWHRLKATASGALVSNRLDVCVPEAGASGCGRCRAMIRCARRCPKRRATRSDVQVVEGMDATFEAAASGVPLPTVQWEESVKGGVFAPVSGATSGVLKITATKLAESGDAYRATFTNAAGKAETSAATLTVTAAPVAPAVTRQPSDATVIEGTEATSKRKPPASRNRRSSGKWRRRPAPSPRSSVPRRTR